MNEGRRNVKMKDNAKKKKKEMMILENKEKYTERKPRKNILERKKG